MAVGGLLHVEIVPCVDVCVVAPDLHAGEQVSGRLRRALQRTVDHGHHLCAGHGLIRAEGAVGITVDPARLCADGDCIGCPVIRGHVGKVVRGLLVFRKLRQHRRKLCARDGLVRAEVAAGSGVHDHTGVLQRGDVDVEPVAAGNIAVAARGVIVCLGAVSVHDPVEDRGHFGAGDIAGRFHGPIRIAVDVGKVLLCIERQRGSSNRYAAGRNLLRVQTTVSVKSWSGIVPLTTGLSAR